ncbi:MAG: 16S rRNA (cytidine(1402)-2'-O)-methyltransferase [Hyphomicrobiales bacterium]|nr:16S rRNA (cytidine(1402)-2'-O)-methyltransferase [Hyphomicrobiales bacterium]
MPTDFATLPADRLRAIDKVSAGVERQPVPAAGLYIVSTPIGNLRDMSLRAIDTLQGVDGILAEDTRVTSVLLRHFGIRTPLVAYHDHNGARLRPNLLARLQAGAKLALVSDAGTPLISDPGYKLVSEARAAGINVVAVPGASAVLAALAVAGLPTDRFCFCGFLPNKPGPRRAELATVAKVPATLVFYESPRRVAEALADMLAIFGPRPASVARELTKHYETVRAGTLAELAAQFGEEEAPRGEIVIVVGPPGAEATALDASKLDEAIKAAMTAHSMKDAAEIVSAATGLPRRQIYARALELGRDTP